MRKTATFYATTVAGFTIVPDKVNGSKHTAVLIHLHVAALLLGGTALFSKLISYSAVDIIAYRTLICGLVLVAIAKAMKQKLWPGQLRHLLLLILCSALFTVHWTAYFQAMKVSTVAIGIVSMFTFPVMTVLLEPLINKTRLEPVDVLMGVLVLFGVFLIVPQFDLDNNITQGVLFGLCSALAVALRNIFVARWLSQYSAFSIMSFHALVSAAILLPISSVAVANISPYNWGLLFLLGTVFTAIPHTQKTYGLLHESAKTVSMIVSLQVVYATIFAYLLLGEVANWQTITGGGLILFAAIFESLRARK